MRKLASIQVIEEIQQIPDALSIMRVRILGWWCVAQKEEFKVGDKCCYFEVDSLLPNIPQFEFLAKGQKLKKSLIENGKEIEGYRLKTAKKLGVLSQGLALPLKGFPGILDDSMPVGADVSELVGVYKYDPPLPVCISGEAKGYVPGSIPRTDEERIQSNVEWLEEYRGQHFYSTSKIDGTSSTFYKIDGIFGACGHNIDFKESKSNTFWRLAYQYNLVDRLAEGYAIQGEVAGEGIQSNRLRLKGVDLFVFYVIDINRGEYLPLDDMRHFVKELGVKTVPVVHEDIILNHTCEEILKMADMPSPLNPELPQEGLVFRMWGATQKVSFKAISNAYLLKWGL